jgi:hypothetical protein
VRLDLDLFAGRDLIGDTVAELGMEGAPCKRSNGVAVGIDREHVRGRLARCRASAGHRRSRARARADPGSRRADAAQRGGCLQHPRYRDRNLNPLAPARRGHLRRPLTTIATRERRRFIFVMSHSTDRMTPLYTEGLNTRRAHGGTPESLWPSAIPGEAMEHLWSPAGATGGNRWQMADPRKPLKQAYPQPVATHGNRFGAMVRRGSTVRVRQRA